MDGWFSKCSVTIIYSHARTHQPQCGPARLPLSVWGSWHWLTFTICVVSVVEDTVYGQPEALHRKRVMGIGVGLNQASPRMGCVTSSELFNSNRRPLQKYVPLLNSTARVPGNNGDRSPTENLAHTRRTADITFILAPFPFSVCFCFCFQSCRSSVRP